VVRRLRREASAWGVTTLDAERSRRSDPYRVLIATVLSQRTKDEHTAAATRRLFRRAKTPRGMLRLAGREIAGLIFPVGFHRTKAKTVHRISRELLERFGGEVPSELDDLLSLHGVGRKTANLVLTHGFHTDGICVDIHVHRTLNRIGYVRTGAPDQTEMALRRRLPREHWREINGLLVAFGQTICRPISPLCSRCPIRPDCRRIGVERSR
jgi:endonuclease-3